MKFRRIGCDCCKSSDAAKLCTTPTYVISEVMDDSNVIFVLMNKQGRPSCRGPLALSADRTVVETQAAAYGHGLSEPRAAPPARRAEASDAWRRPTRRQAGSDDFEGGESPIRRNQRLLQERSGFWPRARSRDSDGVLREWE